MKPRYEHPGVPGGTTFTCFVRREAAFDFAWHFHREYELTLITEGSGRWYVGSAVERYGPGDLVLLGPELPHTFASDPSAGTAAASVVQFRHDFLGADFFGLPQFRSVAGLLARSVRGLRFTGVPDEVRHTLATRLPVLPAAAQTLELLRTLDRLTADAVATAITGPGYDPAPSTAVRDRVDAVCRHLQRHHTRPVRLADVAALVHMSPTSLSRFFRRAMGRTLTDHVNRLRVETACALLTGTAWPVTDIAARSGYQNLSNFNRRFKELKGLSPTQYRAAQLPVRTAGRV